MSFLWLKTICLSHACPGAWSKVLCTDRRLLKVSIQNNKCAWGITCQQSAGAFVVWIYSLHQYIEPFLHHNPGPMDLHQSMSEKQFGCVYLSSIWLCLQHLVLCLLQHFSSCPVGGSPHHRRQQRSRHSRHKFMADLNWLYIRIYFIETAETWNLCVFQHPNMIE
jgi:hypothetical protein